MSERREFENEFSKYSGEVFIEEGEKQLTDKCFSKLHSTIHRLLQVLDANVDGDSDDNSIYTGTAGFALLHMHLASRLKDSDPQFHLRKASKWLRISLKKLKGSRLSFLCGDAGPIAIGAVLSYKEGNQKSHQEYISMLEDMCQTVCTKSNIPDELLYGRCGYLSALLFVQKHCGVSNINRDCVIMVVKAVLRSGKEMSRRQRLQHPLMYEWHDKAYLGAAHGLAGIYYILLQVKEPTLQEEIYQLVRPCIDFMLTLQFASGNCPSSLGSSNGDKLVHWCHGAPGWVHLFALAYKIFRDPRYLQAAKNCGEVIWRRGLLRKGYGLCHGTAGNAYAFLTLYKLTKEHRYIYYAYKFAEWCCEYGKHGCRTPDRPYSMFEGMAGTVYFLSDMLEPATSAFPAFEFGL